MNFSKLDHLADRLLAELETDLEPAFKRQSEVVLRHDTVVHHNQDWCVALQRHLELVQSQQSMLQDHERLLERQFAALEQSISTLEQCPRQAWPWCVGGAANSSRTSRGGSNTKSPLAGLFNERNELYQRLLKLPTEMNRFEHELLPNVERLRGEIDDVRTGYEKNISAGDDRRRRQ
ncbi:uncharacterized protein LOC129730617 isoform X2 [Wyeomyia smithii]|uniref:uncharacterized protein LOC129730617 isoform X2 n=1 Tax=Wyeomyia smithii TaxID=174621 RepID=UPI002467EDB3|nr:uncharacterized protein LOC129730617 isoform X2 [Wyeomyia smithii]